jgi:hypothetical protein
MTRVCTICTHYDHHQINEALVRRVAYRHIAAQYGVSTQALQRHAKDHIPALLVEAYKAQELSDAESLATELAREKEDVQRLKMKAEADEDYRTALLGVDKAMKALELQARVESLIVEARETNVTIVALADHPGYSRLEEVLFDALAEHAEARFAVADALSEIQGELEG